MLKRLLDFHRLHADLRATRRVALDMEGALTDVMTALMGAPYFVTADSTEGLRATVHARLMDHGIRQRDLGYNEGYLAALHSSGAMDVVSERRRQVRGEGFTDEHDDECEGGEIASAAAAYAHHAGYDDGWRDYFHREGIVPTNWPWSPTWWRPTTRRRDLVKAGALILAEIERLDRLADREAQAAVAEALKTIQPAPRFSDRLRTLLRNLRPRLYAARPALAKGSN